MPGTKTTSQSLGSWGRVPPAQVTGDLSCLLGQQKGALPPGAGHDVRPDGVAVPAPLGNAAQGRAEGTEAESHIQNRLRQQVNAVSSEKMLSPPTQPPPPLLPFFPPQKLGFIFRDEFATFYLGKGCYQGCACAPLLSPPWDPGQASGEQACLCGSD